MKYKTNFQKKKRIKTKSYKKCLCVKNHILFQIILLNYENEKTTIYKIVNCVKQRKFFIKLVHFIVHKDIFKLFRTDEIFFFF